MGGGKWGRGGRFSHSTSSSPASPIPVFLPLHPTVPVTSPVTSPTKSSGNPSPSSRTPVLLISTHIFCIYPEMVKSWENGQVMGNGQISRNAPILRLIFPLPPALHRNTLLSPQRLRVRQDAPCHRAGRPPAAPPPTTRGAPLLSPSHPHTRTCARARAHRHMSSTSSLWLGAPIPLPDLTGCSAAVPSARLRPNSIDRAQRTLTAAERAQLPGVSVPGHRVDSDRGTRAAPVTPIRESSESFAL